MRYVLLAIAAVFVVMGIYFSQPIWARGHAENVVTESLSNPGSHSTNSFFSELFTLGPTPESDVTAAWIRVAVCLIGASVALGFYVRRRG